jgi:hypothetical protein
MSSVTMELNGAFDKKIDLAVPATMRELISAEAERWRQMEQKGAAGRKSLTDRLGLSSMFRRH